MARSPHRLKIITQKFWPGITSPSTRGIIWGKGTLTRGIIWGKGTYNEGYYMGEGNI